MRLHRVPRGRLASPPGGSPVTGGPGGGCGLPKVPSVHQKTGPPHGPWSPKAGPDARPSDGIRSRPGPRRAYFPRVSGG